MFEFDYVLIPIHMKGHWSLAIVCHPGMFDSCCIIGMRETCKYTRYVCLRYVTSEIRRPATHQLPIAPLSQQSVNIAMTLLLGRSLCYVVLAGSTAPSLHTSRKSSIRLALSLALFDCVWTRGIYSDLPFKYRSL